MDVEMMLDRELISQTISDLVESLKRLCVERDARLVQIDKLEEQIKSLEARIDTWQNWLTKLERTAQGQGQRRAKGEVERQIQLLLSQPENQMGLTSGQIVKATKLPRSSVKNVLSKRSDLFTMAHGDVWLLLKNGV